MAGHGVLFKSLSQKRLADLADATRLDACT